MIVKITNGICNVNGYPCIHKDSEVCDLCEIQQGNIKLPVLFEVLK